MGLEGKYNIFPVPPFPEGQTKLIEVIDQFRMGEIHGLNVTIPHKQTVIPLLDDLTPTAKAIGAVNTIYSVRSDDLSHLRLIGDNTDASGFWTDVQKQAGSGEQIANKSALILGAGGSARAVAYALLSNNYSITIAARRIEQARKLSDQLSATSNQIKTTQLNNSPLTTDHCSLIVNTTPIGMRPHIDASPWPEGTPFPENAILYDLVYNPRETALVKQAKAAGLSATTGLGMLVEQAALAFERWTGLEAPRDVMLDAVNGKQ